MLKTRVMNLFRRLRGGPCPECSTPRPIEWYEVLAGQDEPEDGPPPVCPRCGRIPPPQFVEVVLPAREVTSE